MDTIPDHWQRAKWEWGVEKGRDVAYLNTKIPARNVHPATKIVAYICPKSGEWWVEENDKLVAGGVLYKSSPLWRDGKGPQIEAERVICFGATSLDNARAKIIYDD